ncbi:MAG: tetratricopeptide repeat protein [Bacteroidia bacterium]|nr:tetratricopeptide repeat protein [Bacteroidia bacterium]
MKNHLGFALIMLSVLIFSACSKEINKSKVEEYKAQYEELMNSGQSSSPKTQEVLTLLASAYEEEAKSQADSSSQAEYLYLAAEIHEVSARNVQKALALYDQVINEYPSTERAEDALFHKGFLNNKIKNFEGAKEAYELFIQKYPDSDLVDDAQAEIKYMGLTDEELFEIIKQKADSINSGGDTIQ